MVPHTVLTSSLGCRRKIDIHILPLMCGKSMIVDHFQNGWLMQSLQCCTGTRNPFHLVQSSQSYLKRVQFMDKTTLGNAAILGIRYCGVHPVMSSRKPYHVDTSERIRTSVQTSAFIKRYSFLYANPNTHRYNWYVGTFDIFWICPILSQAGNNLLSELPPL